MRGHARRRGTVRLAAVILSAVLLAVGVFFVPSLTVLASPDAGGRVPYRFHFESLNAESGGGSIIQVFRNLELALGQPIEAAGWLATDEGVSAYQYLWLPVGGGNAEWVTVSDAQIGPRYDLASAGIAYQSGHGTAGFRFTVEPPAGTEEGYYDVYIRALDGMGTPCDLAAILNLRYGEPDVISSAGRTVSISRIGREGAASLYGGAAVEGGAIRLPPDGGVRLGTFNLAAFAQVRITYAFPQADALGGERVSILGLKSSEKYSYGKENEAYNTTDSLVYAPLREKAGELTLELSTLRDNGELWLTGHLNGDMLITGIEFVAKGYATDRVAARINLCGETVGSYFSGYNQTLAEAVDDPVLGEVLRLEVQDATNDPYVQFRAGDLLRDHGIVLNADEYKYMVFLYRADPANNTDRMNLYLCSGSITGATEACNQGVTLQKDGKWHYLVVDLTQKENWGGIINGWRFDYISGNGDPGNGVEFAFVQFFRTAKAAYAVAAEDPLSAEPYRAGDPIVIRDMSEEQGMEDGEFTLDPADTYEVTEAVTEAVTEPVTEPDSAPESVPVDTLAPVEETSFGETDPADGGRGCASVIAPLYLILAALVPAVFLQKKYHTYKGEYHET